MNGLLGNYVLLIYPITASVVTLVGDNFIDDIGNFFVDDNNEFFIE